MDTLFEESGFWVCAAALHLRTFGLDAANIDEFEVTITAGRLALLLNAIRGRGVVDSGELRSIAKAQRIGQKSFNDLMMLIERLDSDRVVVCRAGKAAVGIEEHLTTMDHIYEVAGRAWESLSPSPIERGAVHILRHTYQLPRMQTELLDALSGDGLADELAEATVGVTTSFRIVQRFDGSAAEEAVLFNPYIWRSNQAKIAQVLRRLPDEEKGAVSQCMDTVSKWQAFPLDELQVEPRLLKTAHAVGLVDIVEVTTADQERKEFVFTPHLNTHPDVSTLAQDLLSDVRAVLACVGYGENYSRISRLGGENRSKTINTLQRLLRDGEAGDATAIGVDYQILEERGIISVEPTPTWPGGRYKMILRRAEPISIALDAIRDSVQAAGARPILVHTKSGEPGAILGGPEHTRIIASVELGNQPEHVKEARNHFLRNVRREIF